jgi:4'-phosphopantetheinyl transferase
VTAPLPDEVQLWAIPCTDPPEPVERLHAVLSLEERQRAGRFRFPDDRTRSVVGRGMLRTIVAACLETSPEELVFATNREGKPALDAAAGAALEFNVSHSGRWVVIGVTRQARVGVDVELMRPLSDRDRLIERFFASAEARAIQALAEEERHAAFFACWTRKEAFIKAIGSGLQFDLKRFEVAVRADGPAALLTLEDSVEAAARWRLWSAAPEPGYLAAVATEAPGALHAWYWSGSAGLVPWHLSGLRTQR